MTANLKAIPKKELIDGAPVTISEKEVGRSDIYPQAIKHSPNGLNVMISDGEEYIIYKVQGFKNVHFGQGAKFVWSQENGYAVHKGDEVRIFDSSFNQRSTIKTSYQVEGLHGGPLLGIRTNDFIMFYDWDSTVFVQKIEINCKDLYWNSTSYKLAVAAPQQLYLLQFNPNTLKAFLSSGKQEAGDDGIDEAFSIESELTETVISGIWLKNCFFYVTSQNKLNYVVKDKPINYAYLERPSSVLGYMSTQGALFFVDGANRITSYEIPQNFPSAISSIAEEDFDSMRADLDKIENNKFHDKVAKYLEAIDNIEIAFEVVKNPEMKFEYALKLEKVDEAHQIAIESGSKNSLKAIGDLCLLKGEFAKAEHSFKLAEDLSSLLLLYSSLGDGEGIKWLAETAVEKKAYTVGFNSYWLLRNLDKCVEILLLTKNFPEAAFFAKTYCPSHISKIVQLWKESLLKSHPVVSGIIADPMEYDNDEQFAPLFLAQKVESLIKEQLKADVPAHHYLAFQKQLEVDLVTLAKESSLDAVKEFVQNSLGKIKAQGAADQPPTKEELALAQDYAGDV